MVKNNRDFDIRDDETFTDWKIRKNQENGLTGSLSQSNSGKKFHWCMSKYKR